MKICDLTNFYHEQSGGVKTYLHQKMDYIADCRGVEHLVIVPGAANLEKRRGNSTIQRLKAPELPFARPYRLIMDAGRVDELLGQFSPDIIEVGCPYFLPLAIAARRKYHCRLAGFYHSDFPRAYVRTTARLIGRIPAAMLEKAAFAYVRAMYRRMDLTLAPSLAVASALVRHGVGNVQVLSLGVDMKNFHPGLRSRWLRLRLGIAPEQVLLLYVGRFAREKGLDVLMPAFELLSAQHPGRYHLLLIGGGALEGELREWAAGRAVTVGGYLPADQVAAVYASADLFVTAGRAETFGLTVLEAQASGLPVVAAASGAAAETVAPGAGVLIRPDDPAGLAAAIAGLPTQNLRSLGRQARRYVEVNYGWEKTFRKLFAFYRELLGFRRQPLAEAPSGATGRKIAGA
ncbi:glycosyltransferase [Desulfotomaculum copahuensis]|uniref:Glycosyltransferase subfamily 4-like N-terminal domain-containing protein n=1 Tax=Desulfotomaculum copahuensis TaxID=1838280 RepID=A0A1B7LKQ2_9FIRM|nr:glycosyltransferase [Desulfotomaculum copahuensis]OAT87113.1 hypothetical protein A6M21_02170 [Desulfotomaculum copahuensis]